MSDTKENVIDTQITELQSADSVPYNMRPFLNISDLDNFKFEKMDVGLNAAVERFGEDGYKTINMSDSDRDAFIDLYKSSYEFRDVRPSEEELYKDAEKAFESFQKQENREAYKQARLPVDYSKSETSKTDYINNYVNEKRQYGIDSTAIVAKSDSLPYIFDDQQASVVTQAINSEMDKADTYNKVYTAMEFMKKVKFEYLTRGARLMCTEGKIFRYLNLPQDHGLLYGKQGDPVIDNGDCKVGDMFNISNFGICLGHNPPPGEIKMARNGSLDQEGRYMTTSEEDAFDRGSPCIPTIVSPGWINTYDETAIGISEAEAVSTKSFLVCNYGGIIFPFNSGQQSKLEMQLNDSGIKEEFDGLYNKHQSLKAEENGIYERIIKKEPHTAGYTALEKEKASVTSEELAYQLIDKQRETKTYRNELGACVDRVREDSYGGDYEDIPDERKATLGYMLGLTASLPGGDAVSVKSDYYAYRRRHGYNSKSLYGDDNAGFEPGSDKYIDWRAARIERKSEKEAKQEYNNWKEDVDTRGYYNLSDYEKEEYDRFGKIYGEN